eukprot:3280789-Alexandrium_andersonii.AAC.1
MAIPTAQVTTDLNRDADLDIAPTMTHWIMCSMRNCREEVAESCRKQWSRRCCNHLMCSCASCASAAGWVRTKSATSSNLRTKASHASSARVSSTTAAFGIGPAGIKCGTCV